MATDYKVIACIPAYNEANSIGNIIRNAKQYCSEVVVCDDGSVDNTDEVAKRAGAIVLKHDSNKGYGAAIQTLFDFSTERNADIVVTIDSDGQHNAKDIPEIIKPIHNQEADIVIGSRFLTETDKQNVPRYRAFGIKAITKLTQAASYSDISDSQSGFRAYNKKALSKIKPFENGMSVSTEILLKAKEKNLTVKEVPVTITYNKNSSSQNPLSHGMGVMTSVVQFVSLKHPLAFYGLSGIGLLIISIYYMSSALEIFSATRYVSTPLILLSVGATIVGIVLLATGVILSSIVALFRQKGQG